MSETRERYNAGQPEARPDPEQVITQRLTFADGSEIIVIVKAPPGERPPGLLAADLATRHYYAYLLKALNLIESMAGGTSLSAENTGTADLTRACFNCESGMMTRTDDPEPGWYCVKCDTFLPDDQNKPRPGIIER